MKTDAEIVAELFPPKPKPKRRKPSRCLGCGRVSARIFCSSCHKERTKSS